jgi:hypothetical protein
MLQRIYLNLISQPMTAEGASFLVHRAFRGALTMKRLFWQGCLGLGLGVILLAHPLFSQEEGENGPEKGIFDQVAILKSEEAPVQEGVEPLAKGVIHEAFASPAVFTAQASVTVAKEPPQAIEEMPPEHKPDGDNVQWINGYFAYDEDRADFYWVSGIWRNIPPNMEWVPGTWNQSNNGWQYFSGFWKQAGEGDLTVVPMPPEPLQTADPPSPSADSSYVPGSWVYRETRYVWRPACWVSYRHGWVWVPARYQWTHCGWVFVEGYWDYTLGNRGLLFSPVYVNSTYYSRPNWIYRPHYVVHNQSLLSCLFVQRRTGCYHFGDYYTNNYANSGYVTWSSYRVNRYPEPLFHHYRYVNRHDPRWETSLTSLHVARYKGEAPRPPASLLFQKKLNNNNNIHINNLVLLAPVTKVNKQVVPMKTLDATQMQKHVQNSQKQKESSKLRAQNETKLAKTLGNVKVGDQPKVLALNLPKTTQTTVVTNKIKNLPPPPQGNKNQLSTKTTTTGEKTTTTNPKGKETVTPKGKETTPPKGKETVTPPKGKEKDNTPPKGKEITPPKGKETDAPPKGKEKDNTPKGKETTTPLKGKDKETTNPPKGKESTTPFKGKETTTTPSKDKGTVNPPGKDKEKEKTNPSSGEKKNNSGKIVLPEGKTTSSSGGLESNKISSSTGSKLGQGTGSSSSNSNSGGPGVLTNRPQTGGPQNGSPNLENRPKSRPK